MGRVGVQAHCRSDEAGSNRLRAAAQLLGPDTLTHHGVRAAAHTIVNLAGTERPLAAACGDGIISARGGIA